MNIKRRPFGKTGLSVSEVSFGAMNLRMLPDVSTGMALIHGILDAGVNCIDTARAYDSEPGAPVLIQSEVMVGNAIEAREASEPLVIITKGHGYTPEAFRTHLGESLERLKVRKLGDGLFIGKTPVSLCYLLHGIKDDRWEIISGSGVLDFAAELRAKNDYSFLGFSSHYRDGEVIGAAIETGAFHLCELPYNVYNPVLGAEGPVDYIKMAYDHGMGVVNMKAFNGNGTAPIFEKLSGITGIGYGDMARFCLANPYVSTIDAGVRSIDEFRVDAGAAAMPGLKENERQDLLGRAALIAPHFKNTCRECMHCVEKFECPQQIDFPRILGLYGRYVISSGLGLETDEYTSAYKGFTTSADACISCGKCLEWCEYHLNIPELMTQAKRMADKRL